MKTVTEISSETLVLIY